MGISVGNGSVKPYVGGAEIKEAYVGSELVYRASLPYLYYFLGAESDYVLNSNVQLDSGNNYLAGVVKKYETTYVLSVAYNAQLGRAGRIKINNLSDYVGKTLEFVYKNPDGRYYDPVIEFYNGSNIKVGSYKLDHTATTNTLFTVNIPAGSSYLYIYKNGESGLNSEVDFDSIRLIIDTPKPATWEAPVQEGSKLKVRQAYFARKNANKLEVE